MCWVFFNHPSSLALMSSRSQRMVAALAKDNSGSQRGFLPSAPAPNSAAADHSSGRVAGSTAKLSVMPPPTKLQRTEMERPFAGAGKPAAASSSRCGPPSAAPAVLFSPPIVTNTTSTNWRPTPTPMDVARANAAVLGTAENARRRRAVEAVAGEGGDDHDLLVEQRSAQQEAALQDKRRDFQCDTAKRAVALLLRD